MFDSKACHVELTTIKIGALGHWLPRSCSSFWLQVPSLHQVYGNTFLQTSSSNHHYIFPSVVMWPHKPLMELLMECTFLFACIASPVYTVVLFFLWQTLCKIFFNKQARQLHRAGQYHFLQGSRYCCSGILFHYSPELQDLYHLVNMCTWNSHSTLATCWL